MASIPKLITLRNELKRAYILAKHTQNGASEDLQIVLFLTIAHIERKIRWHPDA
jgi:hypothetical protein